MKSKIYTFTHWAAYLTILHGLAYLGVKYFMQADTPYGARPHWSQGYLQSLHILLSPLFLFAMGLLWNFHIMPKLKSSKKKRKSGIALLCICLIMVASGYGVQAFYQETLKTVQVWAHVGAGCLFPAVYLLHHFRRP